MSIGIRCTSIFILIAKSIAFFYGTSKLTRGITDTQYFSSISMSSTEPGLHGANFKFMPSVRIAEDEYYPRILHIAGVYPGITVEDLVLPISPPNSPPGKWTFDFADPLGPQLGTVAIPGSATLYDCIDPVVVITSSTALGMTTVMGTEEVLVVVDREDRQFSPAQFFMFRSPYGAVQLGNLEDLEEGFEVLGRVALCILPFAEEMKKSTGFLEDE